MKMSFSKTIPINNVLKINFSNNNFRFYSYKIPRRALLYVPGNDERKFNKALKIDVDCIALDCEDGVALNKKEEARNSIHKILQNPPKKNNAFDLGVRVNSLSTNFFEEDIKCVLTSKHLPNSILLPKVETKEDIKEFAEKFSKYVTKDKAPIDLIAYIESPTSFINLKEICMQAQKVSKTSNIRLAALVFGSDDFCAALGVTRTQSSEEILYARQKLVLYSKAFNLQAIDMVYINYKDLEGLKLQAEEGARMGYTGKQVIHPDQVNIVQNAFLPSEEKIQWATSLLKSFNEHQKDGKGAFTHNGQMIDMPTVRQAQNIINLINTTK